MLLVAVAASTVGLGMIAALLADLQDTHGFADWGLGVITGSSFVTAFVAYVWFSEFADRGHARPMLVSGALITAAAMVWIAHATELWQFVVARSLVGLGGGIFVPAVRKVAIQSSPDQAGRELGLIFSASVAGFVLGPVLGGWLAPAFGLGVPFYVAAITIGVTLPFVARMEMSHSEETAERVGVVALLRNRMVIAGILIGSSEFFVLGALEAVWARRMTDLGASTSFIGTSFALLLVPLVVVAPFGGRLADRHDPRRVALAALIFVVPLTFLYGRIATPVGLAAIGAIHSVGSGIIGPAAAAAVAAGSPKGAIARGQGLLEAFGFLSAAAAAFASGALYGAIGAGPLFALVAAGLIGYMIMGGLFSRGPRPDAVPYLRS